jgi:hypothetical protein
VIRPARPDDAAALRALDRATWAWDFSPAPCAPEDAPLDGAAANPIRKSVCRETIAMRR